MTCKECGKVPAPEKYYRDMADAMRVRQLCFHCLFWTKHLERSPSVIINGEHYIIGDEKPDTRAYFRGFSGRKFVIMFNNGEKVTTTNLWYQGKIPEHFRDRMPDNASMVEDI